MEPIFIGREQEQEILREALASHEAEMVAVIGRRRVGKTFLIKHVYEDHMVFSASGELGAPLAEHMKKWSYAIQQYSGSKLPLTVPDNWLDAFILLIEYLKTQDFKQKKVVFLDELSWLASDKSGFLRGLSFFWNNWAVNQSIVVVICGSAASWMIQNLVNDKGGLHNRITRRILLKPFTLKETQQYFTAKKHPFTPYELVSLYMALGGIPHYLKEVKGNRSVVQNIDSICFSETGLLRTEFSNLYFALFENADKHIAIIRALASSHQGLTRQSIVALAKIPENGNTTRVLEELELSGFITGYFSFGKVKKNMLYRLTDEYSLFYLKFIENKVHEGSGTWHHLSQTQEYKTWSGYAFENICFKHIPSIKKALGINGVYSLSSTFYQKATESKKGLQIDLLLDRADRVINIFEIKFSNKEYTLTKEQAESWQRRLWTFAEAAKTKKRLSLVLITTYGISHNMHSLGLVDNVLSLNDLFLD